MVEALNVCVGVLAGVVIGAVVAAAWVAWENGYFRRG
jgi:hypothetical protein